MTDFLVEERYNLKAKIAYRYWEARGRPIGSPEVDWFAAERAVDSFLADSGTALPFSNIQLEPYEGPYRYRTL